MGSDVKTIMSSCACLLHLPLTPWVDVLEKKHRGADEQLMEKAARDGDEQRLGWSIIRLRDRFEAR